MTNPTNQEIIAAYDALDTLCDRVPATRSAKERILKALPPKPQPTMAETQWDEDKHYLAEAEYVNGGTVIMLDMHKECDEIKCLTTADDSFRIVHLRPKHLIPTSKRYILAEVEV